MYLPVDQKEDKIFANKTFFFFIHLNCPHTWDHISIISFLRNIWKKKNLYKSYPSFFNMLVKIPHRVKCHFSVGCFNKYCYCKKKKSFFFLFYFISTNLKKIWKEKIFCKKKIHFFFYSIIVVILLKFVFLKNYRVRKFLMNIFQAFVKFSA